MRPPPHLAIFPQDIWASESLICTGPNKNPRDQSFAAVKKAILRNVHYTETTALLWWLWSSAVADLLFLAVGKCSPGPKVVLCGQNDIHKPSVGLGMWSCANCVTTIQSDLCGKSFILKDRPPRVPQDLLYSV